MPHRHKHLLALLIPVAGLAAPGVFRGASPAPPERTVFIALDAVPYSVARQVTDPARGEAALFRGLSPPVPLVSTLPSTTSLAFAAILEPFGMGTSLGYEARFYDRDLDKIRGGGFVSYRRLVFPWREFFDWKVSGVLAKMLGALRPVRRSVADIDRSLEAFLASDASHYFIYYFATDLAGHLAGPQVFEEILASLDAKLEEARRRSPERPFSVVVFSDHGLAGGEPLRNVRRGVRRQLARTGLRARRHLRGEGDVVLVPFGLVSSFVAFTRPGREGAAAEAMAGAEGVDLCAFPEGEGWRVESARGAARIERHGSGDDLEWSYRPEGGDPLGLEPALAPLRERTGRDRDRFPDEDWFEVLAVSDYPDAFYRIARAFDLVENPASVVCSTAIDAMYGAARTEIASRLSVGRLRWTHGALHREASLGFLMTDVPGWEETGPLRFSEALRPFVEMLGQRPPPER